MLSPDIRLQLTAHALQTCDVDISYLRDIAAIEPRLPHSMVMANMLLDDIRAMGNTYSAVLALSGPRPGLQLIGEIYLDLQTKQSVPKGVCSFIGRHIAALSGIMPGSETGPECSLDQAALGVCATAESGFCKALDQVESDSWQGHHRISVYHNEDGVPLLLRKSTPRAATAITLAPMHLSSMPILPGTIVRPSDKMHRVKTGEAEQGNNTKWSYETYLLPRHIKLALGRISAMAYTDLMDRLLFSVILIYPERKSMIEDEKLAMLKKVELGAFQRAARKIMRYCDVRCDEDKPR